MNRNMLRAYLKHLACEKESKYRIVSMCSRLLFFFFNIINIGQGLPNIYMYFCKCHLSLGGSRSWLAIVSFSSVCEFSWLLRKMIERLSVVLSKVLNTKNILHYQSSKTRRIICYLTDNGWSDVIMFLFVFFSQR